MAKQDGGAQLGDAAFLNEEKHRGRDRKGRIALPAPHFSQIARTQDTGARLTPEMPIPQVKAGRLKFEKSIDL